MNMNRKGSVLILTLIIVTFLSALALQLSHSMRSKNRMVRTYQKDIVSLHIARGAVGKVLNAIERDKAENELDYLGEDWMAKFMRDEHAPKVLEWRDAQNRVIGKYAVRITDESAKININTAELDNLKLFLDTFKGVGSTDLARNIINYRDGKGKNKVYYSIHELLLLRGIDKDMFLGEDANENGYADMVEDRKGFMPEVGRYSRSVEPGLKDHVTVWTDGKININTAPLSVLLSIPGVDKEIADELIKQRKQKPFALMDDIQAISSIPAKTFVEIVRWANIRSDWFKVVVTAKAENSDHNKVIVAFIDRSGDRAKIKYWREN